MSAPEPVAFYCVADERYFLGAVGLINSLRLVGHAEPIRLLDCGLTGEQRELLAAEAELLDADGATPPWLLKTVAPLARPAERMVLLDTDLVAVRSLAPLLELAHERIVAFCNPIDRYVDEWSELLDLGPGRRLPYASSAAIFAGGELGVTALALMQDRQGAVDFQRTYWRGDEPGYPYTYADQDVFNAILQSRVGDGELELLDQRLAATPPFEGLRLADPSTLRCEYADSDSAEPYLVHHHTVKPWLEPTHDGVYSQLLRRLLAGDDLAIRVPDEMVPRRLRPGPLGGAERLWINARERLRQRSSA